MKDLKKEIKNNISLLEQEFIFDLKSIFEDKLSDKAVCMIEDNVILLAVKYNNRKGFIYDFASEVTIYSRHTSILGHERKSEINYGTSGSFSTEDTSSYWRTIHAGMILLNWDFVCDLTEKYCSLRRDEIDKLNNQ